MTIFSTFTGNNSQTTKAIEAIFCPEVALTIILRLVTSKLARISHKFDHSYAKWKKRAKIIPFFNFYRLQLLNYWGYNAHLSPRGSPDICLEYGDSRLDGLMPQKKSPRCPHHEPKKWEKNCTSSCAKKSPMSLDFFGD